MPRPTTVASDGTLLPVDDLPQVLGYNGSNQLITISVGPYPSKTSPPAGTTFVQTLSYTGSLFTGASSYVPNS